MRSAVRNQTGETESAKASLNFAPARISQGSGSTLDVVPASLVTATSGLLFGFGTAVINGALLLSKGQFHLGAMQNGLAASGILSPAVLLSAASLGAPAELAFVWRRLPETKGKTLEQVESLWKRAGLAT